MMSRYDTIHATIVLGAENVQRLKAGLADYAQRAEAPYAAIIDESGTLLVEHGSAGNPGLDSLMLCSLATGALGAVQQLSLMLDGANGDGFFHLGQTHSFSIVPLEARSSLLTIFPNETPLGLVRSAQTQCRSTLSTLLQEAAAEQSLLPDPFSQLPPVAEGDLLLTHPFGILDEDAPSQLAG